MFKRLAIGLSLISLLNSCTSLKETIKLEVLDFYETKVDSKIVNKSEHSFPKLFDRFEEKECKIYNEKNNVELMNSFFARNKTGPIGKKYVKDMLKKIKKYDKDSLSELDLAVIAVDIFRKDISRTHGKGHYTLKHELSKPLEFLIKFRNNLDEINSKEMIYKIIYDSIPESTQTLDMFLSHESGKYEGDCDDFGRSLLTAYEMMKDLAKNGKDEFSSKLYNGLKRHRIIGLDIKGHAMNGLITYNEDFSIAVLEVIEPQIYLYGSEKSKTLSDKLLFEDDKIYIVSKYKTGVLEKRIITELYSSEVCYEQIRP
ncbi:MAG: hypothetical protein KKF52_03745 [Nanoarchaeota archaeon]|nr:hypothetical protein [Nanoarchaeota archaeon]MBU4242320.1 hypothetical protein [Nanoarchaeota archaeon]MBU4351493.1 hypothetical protein [Nanoarchaeota archaeon]